jgi:hypothetical protein
MAKVRLSPAVMVVASIPVRSAGSGWQTMSLALSSQQDAADRPVTV